MPNVKPLTPRVAVAPQITEADVESLARQGFRTLVSNRPDGESPDQPSNAALAEAAARHGLAFRRVPVVSGTMPEEAVDAFARVLAEDEGPVLAFCRSGTRSTAVWALAEAGRPDGPPIDEIVGAAARAGYDLAGLRPRLEQRRGRPGRG